MSLPPAARPWIAAMLITLAVLAGTVWWIMRPATVAETPATQQRQADGSLMLARRPDPAPIPKQPIPRRATLERVASVTVQPATPTTEAGPPCPPVTVDLSLIREPDGGRRILASSPDGQVVGGLDVPVEPITLPASSRRWAAGLSWAPSQTYGIWLERDVDIPLVNLAARAGVDLNQTAGAGLEARLRIGLAF